jgi:hypothetical protein
MDQYRTDNRTSRLIEAMTCELRTLNLILAAQVLQDADAAEAAARRIRQYLSGGVSHQCMPGMFEDGGA